MDGNKYTITLMLTYAFLLFMGIFYVHFLYKNWKILKFSWRHNGLYWPVMPLIGQVYVALLFIKQVSIFDFLASMLIYLDFPCGIWIGPNYSYISNEPSEVGIILNHRDSFEKAKVYDKLNHFVKGSLTIVPYEVWKPMRREFQRSFKPNVLKTFFPSFYNQSYDLLDEIDRFKGDGFNMFKFFGRYSYFNFFNTSIGLRKEDVNQDIDYNIIDTFEKELNYLLIDLVTPPFIWFKYYPSGKRASKMVNQLRKYLQNVINSRRKIAIKEKHDGDEGFLIDKMLNMNDDHIFAQLLLFVAAATSTTGNSLALGFTLLGMHPDVQEMIYNEVTSFAGNSEIDHDHLIQMKYMEAVVNEILRLFPPIPFFARRLKADINVGTKVLPGNIDFIIDAFHIQRDPRFWEDPLKFDPTRFLPENLHKIQPYTFLPFSLGPRDCIGKRQAILLMKVTIANMVRRFKISSNYKSVSDIRLISVITMFSSDPLDCHFIPRNEKEFVRNH